MPADHSDCTGRGRARTSMRRALELNLAVSKRFMGQTPRAGAGVNDDAQLQRHSMKEGLDVGDHDAAFAAVVREVVRHAFGHAERRHDVRNVLVNAHETVARVDFALFAEDHTVIAQT